MLIYNAHCRAGVVSNCLPQIFGFVVDELPAQHSVEAEASQFTVVHALCYLVLFRVFLTIIFLACASFLPICTLAVPIPRIPCLFSIFSQFCFRRLCNHRALQKVKKL